MNVFPNKRCGRAQVRKHLCMTFASVCFAILPLLAILTPLPAHARGEGRCEARVMLHYNFDRGDKAATMDPRLVLEVLNRTETSRDFLGKLPPSLRRDAQRCRLRVEPVEKNRVIDRFRIVVTAPDEETAVFIADAFAEHCVETYTRETTVLLEKQLVELQKQKESVTEEIARIEHEKKLLCEGKNILDPKSELNRLQRNIHDATREINKELAELQTKQAEYDKLVAETKKFNPALIEYESELRERIAARKKLDDEIEKFESEYLDTNPKMINLRERRTTMETQFQKFLKERNIRESDLAQFDIAVMRNAELVRVGTELKLKEEKVRTARNIIRADEEKVAYIRRIMPQIDRLNVLQRTRQDSLTKLNAAISEIQKKLPLVKDNLRIGGKARPVRRRWR